MRQHRNGACLSKYPGTYRTVGFVLMGTREVNMKRAVLTGLLVLCVTVSGCGEEENDDAGLANPASVFCEENGGTLEMRTDASGTSGLCIFAGGSECEEWAYFRGECGPLED